MTDTTRPTRSDLALDGLTPEIEPKPSGGITFNVLREANRNRQEEWPGNEQADVPLRALEVAGEAGELSEAIKKWLRAERGIKGSTATVEDIASEMGDLLVSLDLLADAMGIDLGQAVREKFNATSKKYDMRTYLGDSDWHLHPEPSERTIRIGHIFLTYPE